MTTSTEQFTIPGYRAGTWTIDPVHTHLGFVIKHMMVSKVRGHFNTFTGTIVTGESVLDTRAEVVIEAASIDTNNETRDNHVRSADFFDAENHPQFRFVSTGVRIQDDEFFMDGDLTIRGTTKPVTLAVETPDFGPNPQGGDVAGFSATAEINRSDFGVSYNGPIPGGGAVLGEKVKIVLDVEAGLPA